MFENNPPETAIDDESLLKEADRRDAEMDTNPECVMTEDEFLDAFSDRRRSV